MNSRSRSIAGSVVIIGTTLMTSLITAALRKGPEKFATLSLVPMFVIFCLAGAVFYTVLKYRTMRDMIFSVFVVTLVHLLIFKVTEPRYFLEFFIYYTALGAAVILYRNAAMPRLRHVRFGKFVIMTALIIVMYSAGTIIASILWGGRSLQQSLAMIIRIHSFTGLALGIGIEAGEMLEGRIFHRPLER